MLLRRAHPDDAMAVARVHVRAWQSGYRGLLAPDYLAQLRAEDRAARYDFRSDDPAAPVTVVALVEEQLCGFASVRPTLDDDAQSVAELCALYVDPAHWGQGIGHALLTDASEYARRQGHRAAVLWLLAGNERGDRFYRRHGWSPDGTTRQDLVWGARVDEVRYRCRWR